MKVIQVQALAMPEIKVIRFGRFTDRRGYFTELFRESELTEINALGWLAGRRFVQFNESYSREGVVRGLHFQWRPPMGKLVRTLAGRMVDLALDVRKGSPTLGKVIAYDMPAGLDRDYDEWIWLPPGFAHGNFFTEPTRIEYLCTAGYNPDCEGGVNPLDDDLDWSLCDKSLASEYRALAERGAVMSDKDSEAISLAEWLDSPEADNFGYP